LSKDSIQAVEITVRKLIANRKFKTALDNAKEFHKAQHTTASESLLLDAYAARIQSLVDQDLEPEAKSLLALVRERFPAAKERLDAMRSAISARDGDLAGILQPLNDPELSSERRAAIELTIQTQVTDLASLAACNALPLDHSLRQAAGALHQAFNAVTSGPVTDEQIALPEVSHRSPLSPWKLLIRAIAHLHRGEDQACGEILAAIKPESIPSRLVPAMSAMLGVGGIALKPADTDLISRTCANLQPLHGALASLDRAFAEDEHESVIFKAVRAAVQECQRSAPELLRQLKQLVFVRGGVIGLDNERLMAALGGAPRQDAAFFRMYARAMETSGDPEDLYEACELWDAFRQEAVKETWFRPNGVEVATLYLHMAEILRRAPDDLLTEFQRFPKVSREPLAKDDRYFLFPEKLYQRACAIDPHREAFSQWKQWAVERSAKEAEKVCREWHRIRPDDLEPILYLMERAAKRNAFPSALSYLNKAERIDAVHSVVRAARLRLLAAGAIRHLQQKKPHLAAEKLVMMARLPQSQQADRPAFLAALRHLVFVGTGHESVAEEGRLEAETLLEGSLAAGLLISGIAAVSKRFELVKLSPAEALTHQQRTLIPKSMARVMAIADDLDIAKFQLPSSYIAETEEQFPGARDSLDVQQIALLGELGVACERPKLAWAASGAGLERGGPTEARFLLLRAQALPPGHGPRYVALAAAAAELGRFHRDMDVVDQALRIARHPFQDRPISLTIDQAREVVRRELASPAFPDTRNPGPSYSDLFPQLLCQCPGCRRNRGETVGLFDEEDEDDFDMSDEEMEDILDEGIPEGMPPELARAFLDIMKESAITGQRPEEIMARILGGGPGGRPDGGGKKGRRK